MLLLTLCLAITLHFIEADGRPIRFGTRTGYSSTGYSYETKYITQKLDHFSFGSSFTFQQRYLVNDTNWKKGGPIFFYCGNEGDITWFCNNTGFMWDIAPDYNAILVFAEHRYYGRSLPFGTDSYKNLSTLSYLTSEQALADFAVLIEDLGKQYGRIPVVAFGGSYGGMLSAWLRMKYPSAVVGAIAASAPIWQFAGLCDCEKPFNIISRLIASYSQDCASNVNRSWSALTTAARVTTGGLEWLTKTFSLCTPLERDASELAGWLESVWFDLAEVNYPYPAQFLQPLPAWPMKATCQELSMPINDDHKLLESLAKAVQVYYNYTGQSACLNVSMDSTDSMGEMGWNFQACTEMVMPMCTDSHNDVFPAHPWVLNDVMRECWEQYGVTPRPYWVEVEYGGKNITTASNIVFSNGANDPWSGGGVVEKLSDSLISIVIKDGGHHVDMRAANSHDTEDIKKARQAERENIDKWLDEYWSIM